MKKLLAPMLLTAGLGFGQVSIGVRIGPPPPPRVVRVRPVAPGPGYFWVDGYWYPVGHRYRWHEGYWTRPPYPDAHWVLPRYEREQFFMGFWEGNHGRVGHDFRWDRYRERDHRYAKEHKLKDEEHHKSAHNRDHDRDHDH